jgi:hypothetical protein
MSMDFGAMFFPGTIEEDSVRELNEFEFWRLNFPDHYSFHESFLNSVGKYPDVRAVAEKGDLQAYTELLGSEFAALKGLAGDFEETVREKDVERVGRFNQLTNIVDIYCRDYNGRRRTAAERVKEVLCGFGGLGSDSYHVRTDRFWALIEALRDREVEKNITLLVPTSLIDELEGCNRVCFALPRGTQYVVGMEAFDEMWRTRNDMNKMCRSIMDRVEHFVEFGKVAGFIEYRGEVLALLGAFQRA